MARVPGMAGRGGSGAFTGAVVVVTGAGGQIGRALLDRLTDLGATAIGLDLPASCPPGDDRFLPCDLTDEGQGIGRKIQRLRRHL